jgi:hypothetical protein
VARDNSSFQLGEVMTKVITNEISSSVAPVTFQEAKAIQARLVTYLEAKGQRYTRKSIRFDSNGRFALSVYYTPGTDVALIPETFEGLTVFKEVLEK